MTEAITTFFHNVFGGNVVLATILISIIPVIELKGAIPFGMSEAFWGERALNTFQAFGFAFLGSVIVVPIIALCFKPLYNWLKPKKAFKAIISFLIGDVENKSQKVNEKEENSSKSRSFWMRILAIMLFVAFPVPLTGVWTGTCFAILLGLNFWATCGSVILGNLICGIIVAFICSVFPAFTNILLYVFLVIVAVAIIVKIVLHIRKKKKLASETIEVSSDEK